MRIVDQSQPIDVHTSYPCTRVMPDGSIDVGADDLQTENAVRVFENGELTMTLMCSADHVIELVVGRLYTEGLISGVDEIDEVWLCEYSTRVLVYLNDRQADLSRRHVETVPSCCTFNKNVNNYFFKDEELSPVIPIPWNAQDVFELARIFESDTPNHKRTFGSHSCYLTKGSEIVYCYEDLGRHNAFDKVVGRALMDGVDLKECGVFTSGRIPTDMAVKAIRAGIPLLYSKAVPTDLTVEMAQSYQLTLICSAHRDSFKVFNDPLNVLS